MPQSLSQQYDALKVVLKDPAIREMAEEIAEDSTFEEVSEVLTVLAGQILTDMNDPPACMQKLATIVDPSSNMYPIITQAAQHFATGLIENDPVVPEILDELQDPEYLELTHGTMLKLLRHKDLAPLFREVEILGPLAFLKYWNRPEVLSKFGDLIGQETHLNPVIDEDEEDEDEEEEVEEVTVHVAAMEGDVEMLQELLDEGADANEVDEEQRTALHFACGYGEVGCATLLLDHGADVDALDQSKNTPLHFAAGYGQAKAVAFLLQSGAKTDTKNSDGYTALQVAKMNGKTAVVKVFESA